MTIELTPAEGITVTTYRGESDGAPVVQIDTTGYSGWLRINLNDGPPLFDGDPERLTEMDAVVAYLQSLGTLTDAAHRVAGDVAGEAQP